MVARTQLAKISVLGSLICFASSMNVAHAYRNPERFGASVDDGGGGGKYFTLSRAEGYGCAVCHSQGSPVPVDIRNLPRTGYIPSQTYRITVDWPDDMPSVALNVEMTDYSGAPFGQLIAPDPSTLAAADLCRESDSPSAGQTIPNDATGRRVLLVAECGQAQTTFDWIAPAAPAQGYFSTSIIFTNRDGKLNGDHVVDVSENLGIQGVMQPATSLFQGCGIAGLRAGGSCTNTAAECTYALLGLGVCLRRRSKRSRAGCN